MAKELFFKSRAQQFYKQMRAKSLERINQSGEGRFEVMYKDLLEPFKKEVAEEYNKLLEHANSINNKKLKQKIIKLLNSLNEGQE
jgi:thymidine kinase